MKRNPPFGDHPFDFSARSYPRSREQLGDALWTAFQPRWGHRFSLRSLRWRSHDSEVPVLFGKRKRVVKRILIVEDEPLTAFDTETMLSDLGYQIVATVDDLDEALAALERDEVHLVIADVQLHGGNLGIELAKSARVMGVPTLLATGHEPPAASAHALGCIRKPYTGKQLRQALESIDRHLQGETVKPPKGLELYIVDEE